MRMTQGKKEERHAAYQLAGVAHCDPRTALKWLKGETVQPLANYALKMAAAQLGIVRPIGQEV